MITRSSAGHSPCLSLWGETRIVTCLLIPIVERGHNSMQNNCTLVLSSVNAYLKLDQAFSPYLSSPDMVSNMWVPPVRFLFQGNEFIFKFGKQTAHTSYLRGRICFVIGTSVTNVIGTVKEFCLHCTQAEFITVSDKLEVH